MYRKIQPCRIRVYRVDNGRWFVAGGKDAGTIAYLSWADAFAAAEGWARTMRAAERWHWLHCEYPTGVIKATG